LQCPRPCQRRWKAAERSARECAEAARRPLATLRKQPRAVHAPAVSASACAAQVGDTNGMNGGAHADGLNGGWKTNSVKPPVKAGGAAPSPAPGGVLNVEAAAERLRHTYAPGKRTWFFWTIIILAANGGLLLGAPRRPRPTSRRRRPGCRRGARPGLALPFAAPRVRSPRQRLGGCC